MRALFVRGPRGPAGPPGAPGGGYLPKRKVWVANGTDTVFTLTTAVPDALKDAALVFMRGIFRDMVDAGPVGETQCTISGTSLTFGAAPLAGSRIEIRYWVNP